MATPCILTYKDKDYTYAEFTALLHDGLLDELRRDKIVDVAEMGKPNTDNARKAAHDFFNKLPGFKDDPNITKSGMDIHELIDAVFDIYDAAILAKKSIAVASKEALALFIDSDLYKALAPDIQKQALEGLQEKMVEGKVTGIKNKIVTAERAQRGLTQVDIEHLRKTNEEVYNNALNIIESGEFNPREQAPYFAEHPTEASAEQQMAFEIDRVKIINELNSLRKELNAATENGDVRKATELSFKISELENAMDFNDRAVTYIGTKIGQALQIRRRLLGIDYSMQRLKSDYYRDNPKATTIPKEIKEKLETFEKEISDLKTQLETAEKGRIEAEGRIAIENIKESVDRDADKGRNRFKLTDAEKIEKQNLKKKYAGMFNDITNIPKLLLEKDFLKYGKLIAKDSAYDFTEFSKRAIDELGEKVKPILREWFDKSSKEAPKEDAPIGLQKRVREIVSEGVTDIDEISKTIQKEMFPEKSVREVRDEITNYGKQLDVTPDDLTTLVNRAKREGVLISKIEDAQGGKRPLRKLLGKDTPTDRERAYNRQLNELLKTLPLDETDAYRKVKSATDAKVTRLKNRITDLKERIAALKRGETPEKQIKKSVPSTDEIKKLESEKDALVKEAELIEGKQRLTDAEYIARWKERAENNIKKYQDKIDRGDYSVKKKRLPVHDVESAELLGKLNAKKEEYELFREKNRLKNRGLKEKSIDMAFETLGMAKALKASMDFSAPFRQGIIQMARHPQIFAKAFGNMFRFAISEKDYDKWLHTLKGQPIYDIMRQSGVYLAEQQAKMSAREEQFVSSLPKKIPIYKNLYKGSERAYSGFLNKLRTDVFIDFHDNLIKDGLVGEELAKELKSFAEYLNSSLGRGHLGRAEAHANLLNGVFFSPRFVKSRFDIINPLFYTKMSKSARMEALKTTGSFIGMGLTVMAISKLSGAEVDDDPRSSNFGKIKIGQDYYDVWGGETQMARFLVQFFGGEIKKQDGEIQKLNEGKFMDKTRMDLIGRFTRGKLSPGTGIIVDYLSGKDFQNMPFDGKKELLDMVVPLYINDLQSVYKDEGMGMMIATGIPSMVGIGVQHYEEKEKKKKKHPYYL